MSVFAHHGTLIAGQVSTVTLTSADGTVEIINRTGIAEIYFTVGAPSNEPIAPTVEGDDCYVVPEGLTSYVVNGVQGAVIVRLISSGTPKYSVIGGQP